MRVVGEQFSEGQPTDYVEVHLFGSCNAGSRRGYWKAEIRDGYERRVLSGVGEETTHIRMTMTAAVEALRYLDGSRRIVIHSELEFLVNGMRQGWWMKWWQNDWHKPNGEPVKNVDLWQGIVSASDAHDVTWVRHRGKACGETLVG